MNIIIGTLEKLINHKTEYFIKDANVTGQKGNRLQTLYVIKKTCHMCRDLHAYKW